MKQWNTQNPKCVEIGNKTTFLNCQNSILLLLLLLFNFQRR